VVGKMTTTLVYDLSFHFISLDAPLTPSSSISFSSWSPLDVWQPPLPNWIPPPRKQLKQVLEENPTSAILKPKATQEKHFVVVLASFDSHCLLLWNSLHIGMRIIKYT
jgi:hypothetical protein